MPLSLVNELALLEANRPRVHRIVNSARAADQDAAVGLLESACGHRDVSEADLTVVCALRSGPAIRGEGAWCR